jgi:hypothetical protein
MRLEDAVIVVPTSKPAIPEVTPSDAEKVGVPEAILTAAVRYAEWREELTAAGLAEEAMHAAMLTRAEEQGGVIHPGEAINLSSWSKRMGIPRPVLEALVLAAHRASVVPPPPAPVVPPVILDDEEEAAWTPPPRALRQPSEAGPPSSHRMR